MENFKKGGYDRRPAEGRREYGSRPGRNEGRPGRSFGEHNDRPRRSFGDSSDRPRRSFGENSDRPRRSYGEGFDRPRRSFGDNSDRPRRSYGDNSDRPRRSFGEGSDRPRRSFGDNQDRPHRQFGEGNDRPRRTFGENSDRPRRSAAPRRSFQDNGFTGIRTASGAKLRPRKKSAPAESAAEQGINRMISRKQVIDDTQFSDNDYVNIPVKETVRLNKFIANSGICSRREADNFIQAGVVTVNGEVVTELGTKININTDDIRFNGERLRGEAKVYIIMNKPKGYVTTASDPHADKTVMDLIKKCPARVFPVGRLDKNTTGVLMFTNDGEMAEKLTHPSYEKKKIYQVTLSNKLSQEDFDKILAGVTLNDGEIKADELEYIDDNDHRKIGIEIHSGKNRIVRRIFESLGYEVKGLDRVYFAGLTKKGIKRGGWRYLTDGEINILRMGAYK
ncbi:MAG: pseudouridine synthase [Bacteroidetes bacterium]|uniref:Pseudouridine synthase n=1 Tax=Candidatus Cryptobacteroides faecigallinarum TaxID=2840763 RepID=A0A9D9INJ9_9BACT|nr:pseudouridine synthase [Candidatus Cryptobacteroides faecigallinarum]